MGLYSTSRCTRCCYCYCLNITTNYAYYSITCWLYISTASSIHKTVQVKHQILITLHLPSITSDEQPIWIVEGSVPSLVDKSMQNAHIFLFSSTFWIKPLCPLKNLWRLNDSESQKTGSRKSAKRFILNFIDEKRDEKHIIFGFFEALKGIDIVKDKMILYRQHRKR